MRLVLDGPRRASGERLGFGLPIGTNSWGLVGIWKSKEVDGELRPIANDASFYFRWITEDPDFDWTTMDFATFERLTDLGSKKFAEFAINDANLSRFRAANGRLLISQAVNDQIVMYENTVDYYRRVAESAGGIEESRTFVRLFSTDGDIHGSIAGPGPGLTPASAMSALMNWVENGIPPEEIIAERVDPQTGELVATRPVYPYPDATIYRGTGDPSVAASFMRAKGAAA